MGIFRAKPAAPTRRELRSIAYRSGDLNAGLRPAFAWAKSTGFKRLGSTAWIRSLEDEHHIAAVQAGGSGWDPYSGNRFVVEFELSRDPRRATGFARQRLWGLLTSEERSEATRLNDHVALRSRARTTRSRARCQTTCGPSTSGDLRPRVSQRRLRTCGSPITTRMTSPSGPYSLGASCPQLTNGLSPSRRRSSGHREPLPNPSAACPVASPCRTRSDRSECSDYRAVIRQSCSEVSVPRCQRWLRPRV